MSEEKKTVIRKRLPAPVVIGLRKTNREHEDDKTEFLEWAKDRCEELGYYSDQVNFENGVVVDPIDGTKILKRLSLEGREKEIMVEARDKIREINKVARAFGRSLADVSLKYGIPAKSLNLDTGEITEDVTFVEAKTVTEQTEEAEKKVAKADKVTKLFDDAEQVAKGE